MSAKSEARRVMTAILFIATFFGSTSLSEEEKLSVAQLVTQLNSIDPKLRTEAANELAEQPIVSVTRGTESLKILGSAEDGLDLSVVIEKLRELTKDQSTGPAFAAHVTLAKLGDKPKEHIAFLNQQIGHSDSNVRCDAIYSLSKLGPDAYECVPKLADALDDESMEVKLAAAVTLGEIGPAAKPAIGKLKVFLKKIVSLDPTKPEVIIGCSTVTLAIAHIGVNPEIVAVTKRENDWLIKIRVLPAMYKYVKEKPIGMVNCLNMLRLVAVMSNIAQADAKAEIEKALKWMLPMSPNTASIEYSNWEERTIAWRGLLVTNVNRETVLHTETDSKLTPLEIFPFPDKPRTPVVHIRKIMGDGVMMIPGHIRLPEGKFDPKKSMIERVIEQAAEPLPASSDASMWDEDGMLVLSLLFPAKGDVVPSSVTFLGDKIAIGPYEAIRSRNTDNVLYWTVPSSVLNPDEVRAVSEELVAYSLDRAAMEVSRADGSDFRQRMPDLWLLGGITEARAFVFNKDGRDVILIGKHNPKAELTLDDFVVALRSRFVYKQWPTMRIRSTDSSVYKVHFEGGIEDTRFGQVFFDAYRLTERIALGLEKPNVPELRSYPDLASETAIEEGLPEYVAGSLFCFHPGNMGLEVGDRWCAIRNMNLSLSIDGGKTGVLVPEMRRGSRLAADVFAQSFNENFSKLTTKYKVFTTMENLLRLVTLSFTMQDSKETPNLQFWLEEYQTNFVETPDEAPILHVERSIEGKKIDIRFCGKSTDIRIREQ